MIENTDQQQATIVAEKAKCEAMIADARQLVTGS
jgi:hypothetical protein